MASESDRLDGDLRVALLTGAAGWRDRSSEYSRAEMATVGILLALVAAAVTVLLVSAGLPGHGAAVDGAARWVVAGVGTITLVVGIAPSLAWPLGWRPRRLGPVHAFALVRVVAATVLIGCWTALLGPVSPVPVWVLGGVVGCEYTLTAWALGLRTGGASWWWAFQRSSLHAGMWLVSLGVWLIYPDRLWDLLRVLLSFQVMALGAAIACHGLERLRGVFDCHRDRATRAVAVTVHDRLARWLHDEVTSSLGSLKLRLRSGQISATELQAELEELEHRIRLQQLDELLASGAAGLADIIQPFVRVAQSQGVEVLEVPHRDESVSLQGESARLARRALGVLVPNAISAGAKALALRMEPVATPEMEGIVIELEDDAGGFDLASAPHGRGLDLLQRDLGPGKVSRIPVPGGSQMRVTIEQQNGAR